MSSKTKNKPARKSRLAAAPPPAAEPTAEERTRQTIALCYNLIAEVPLPFTRHQQVVQALQFLESLYKQVSEKAEAPAAEAPKDGPPAKEPAAEIPVEPV